MGKTGVIYERSSKKRGPLRQGEILSDIIQVRINLKDIRAEKLPRLRNIVHPWVIIVSQDCDLDWDFKARRDEGSPLKLMPSVLFCEMFEATKVTQDKDKIKQNKNERYHFFQRCEKGADASHMGLPELVVDFKRYFSVPTDEVYARINASQLRRRSRLVSPYLEHFATRFYYFQYRVALPSDHQSEPDAPAKK